MGKTWNRLQTKFLGPLPEPQNGIPIEQKRPTNDAQIGAELAYKKDKNRHGHSGEKKPRRQGEPKSGDTNPEETKRGEANAEEPKSRRTKAGGIELGNVEELGQPKMAGESILAPSVPGPAEQQSPPRKPLTPKKASLAKQDVLSKRPEIPPRSESRPQLRNTEQPFKENVPPPSQAVDTVTQPLSHEDTDEVDSASEGSASEMEEPHVSPHLVKFERGFPPVPFGANAASPNNPIFAQELSEPDGQSFREDFIRLNQGMEKIYDCLRGVRAKYPDLIFEREVPYPCSPADVEMVLQVLSVAYQTTLFTEQDLGKEVQQLDKDINSLREKHKMDEIEAEEKINTAVQSLRAEFGKIAAQRKNEYDQHLKSLKKEHESAMAQMVQDHNQNIASLLREKEREIGRLEGSISELKDFKMNHQSDHQSEMKAIRESHGVEIDGIRDKYQSEFQMLRDEITQSKEEQANENKRWEERLTQQSNLDMEAAAENLTKVTTHLENQIQDLEGKLKETNDAIQSSAEGYEFQLVALKEQHTDEKKQMEERFRERENQLEDEHQKDTQTAEQRLNQAQRDLEAERKAKITELEALRNTMNHDFDQEKIRWNAERDAEKNKLEAQLEAKNEDLRVEKIERWQDAEASKNMYETQISGLIASHREETSKLEEKHRATVLELRTSQKRQTDTYESKIAELKNMHKKEMDGRHRELQLEIQRLKTDIVKKRDYFKAIGDHEFGIRLQDLASDIDDFARVEWEPGPGRCWPFPEYLLRECENERQAKQYILQNTLWVILYEKVFCTPFRVFGKEGLSLEARWTEKFVKDRRATGSLALCPKATPNSEKWRYETIKPYIEAATQPLMEGDLNFKIKQSFDSLLRDVTEDITTELGKVTRIGSSERQNINELVRKATRLWLDAAQQRCRIFFVMSNSGDKPARSREESLGSDGAMDVVVVPELRRLGNAQGERLEKEELVSSRKGVFDVLILRSTDG